MADHVFVDLLVLAKRGTWSRECTLPMLEEAARTAERLPSLPPESASAELEQAAIAATAAGTLLYPYNVLGATIANNHHGDNHAANGGQYGQSRRSQQV